MNYLDQLVEDFNKSLESGADLIHTMEEFNFHTTGEFVLINEIEYNKAVEHLKLEVLDIDKFIKVNGCKPITNPVFYNRDNIPTEDGLLSHQIFGITQNDRAGIFAYIDLNGWYLDPSCYKNWCKIDPNIKKIVHKEGKFAINGKGEIIPDEVNGSNGVDFLRKNINNIKFKTNDSIKRDLRVKYLERNRNRMFINKYLVIPPYYRDTNTGKRSVGVGGVNKIYSQLIIAVDALKTTQEYGFDMSGPMMGRVQEIILNLYDWFCGNSNNTIQTDTGAGISGKLGILKYANMGKTTNYAARLVISAPELKANRPEDMMVNFDKSAIPLAAAIACFRPFVQFYVRSFFEREFIGTEQIPVMDKNGKITYKIPKDPLMVFSDERIKKEMESFLHSYNNRFVPIEVPLEDSDEIVYMQFQGFRKEDNIQTESIFNRRLTWCDIFYQAAVEATRDRMVLITRYPIDSRFNQITTEVEVSSTKTTEPMYIDGVYYKYYPVIREEDIETNTGNKFVDTFKLSNLYLPGMGGDYDGDTITVKAAYTNEANQELKEFRDMKMNFIDLGSTNIRSSSADVIQALYSFTKVLDADKKLLSSPEF